MTGDRAVENAGEQQDEPSGYYPICLQKLKELDRQFRRPGPWIVMAVLHTASLVKLFTTGDQPWGVLPEWAWAALMVGALLVSVTAAARGYRRGVPL